MKKFAALLLVLAMPLLLLGADVKIPASVTVKVNRLIKVDATSTTPIKWLNLSDDLDMIPDSSGKSAILMSPVPGKYKIAVYTADKDGPSEPAYCVVTVEGVAPPVPPGPNPPGPNPPDPVNPAPIAGDGFKVLILEDSTQRAKLPATQLSVIMGSKVREFFKSKCVKGPDGKTPEARIWDPSDDFTGESKAWQDAVKRPRKSLPWIIISNGKTGYEGPLPDTVDKTIELMTKYAP